MKQPVSKVIATTAGVVVLAVGISAVANAATAKKTTTGTTTSGRVAERGDRDGGPQRQRTDEKVVGDASQLAKLKDAALGKYPGATISRIETDADGQGTWEAHLAAADGSQHTVYFDKTGAVSSTADGMGGGPGGGHGGPGDHDGPAAAGGAPSA